MKDIFTLYSAMLVLAFAFAGYEGYALEGLWAARHHIGAQANHYHK